MNIIELISNRYIFTARLQPALFALLQTPLSAAILFPNLKESLSVLAGIMAYFGGSVFLSHIAREMGKSSEGFLYKEWGGKPSVVLLRHRDDTLNRLSKARYKQFLSAPPRSIAMMSEQEEQQSPIRADEGYEAASDWLVANTRDKERFPLVYEELISYGFRRNLYALKKLIYAVDIFLLIVLSLWFYESWNSSFVGTVNELGYNFVGAYTVTFVHLIITWQLIKSDWVRRSAFAYAKQLIESCDRF